MSEYMICLKLNCKNYFRILGLREKFELSQVTIEKKFLQKQRMINSNRNIDTMTEYAALSQAYFNIREPMFRARHIFEITGVNRLYEGRIVNIEKLVANSTSKEKKDKFDEYFFNMRICFRQKDLLGAYEAWCSCNFLKANLLSLN